MKTINANLMTLMVAVSFFGIGCGKSSNMSANTTLTPLDQTTGTTTGGTPSAPDGTGSSTSASSSSLDTVAFKPVSINEFNAYVGLHPLNDPTNFQIKVNMQQVSNGRYAGTVKLSYVDTGTSYTGTFDAGSGKNVDINNLWDANLLESEFNRWFIIDGKYYFSAYFQDNYGAIVVVFDKYYSQADAQGTGLLSGSVYYKNFAQTYAPQSPYRKCWYVYEGPYSCRDSAVINKTSPYPGSGFRKLGTFSGLSKAAVMQ